LNRPHFANTYILHTQKCPSPLVWNFTSIFVCFECLVNSTSRGCCSPIPISLRKVELLPKSAVFGPCVHTLSANLIRTKCFSSLK
jgi:hypothetical protein